jgi:hypothetical protein
MMRYQLDKPEFVSLCCGVVASPFFGECQVLWCVLLIVTTKSNREATMHQCPHSTSSAGRRRVETGPDESAAARGESSRAAKLTREDEFHHLQTVSTAAQTGRPRDSPMAGRCRMSRSFGGPTACSRTRSAAQEGGARVAQLQQRGHSLREARRDANSHGLVARDSSWLAILN